MCRIIKEDVNYIVEYNVNGSKPWVKEYEGTVDECHKKMQKIVHERVSQGWSCEELPNSGGTIKMTKYARISLKYRICAITTIKRELNNAEIGENILYNVKKLVEK